MDGPLPQRLVHYRVTKNIVYDIYKYLMTGGRSFDQPVTAARITIKLREHDGGYFCCINWFSSSDFIKYNPIFELTK